MAQAATPKEDKKLLTALFSNREGAEQAYHSLKERGYSDSEINVMMTDETREKFYGKNSELGTKAMEGAGAGSMIGGAIGAVVAGIAAIGTNVLLPGLGIVIAGPLAAALAGAGAGGAAGGILGAFIGWGIPEDRAKYYEQGLRDGGTVIGVTPRSQADSDYFDREWRNYRGEHIYR